MEKQWIFRCFLNISIFMILLRIYREIHVFSWFLRLLELFVGAKMGYVGACWAYVGACWAYVGAKLGHVGAMLSQTSMILELSWASWSILEPTFDILGLCWPQIAKTLKNQWFLWFLELQGGVQGSATDGMGWGVRGTVKLRFSSKIIKKPLVF